MEKHKEQKPVIYDFEGKDRITNIIRPELVLLPVNISSRTILGYGNSVCLSVILVKASQRFHTSTDDRVLTIWDQLSLCDSLPPFNSSHIIQMIILHPIRTVLLYQFV